MEVKQITIRTMTLQLGNIARSKLVDLGFTRNSDLMTKPMELCEETRARVTGKRKADEFLQPEDGDIEEQGGKSEESEASSREEGQEWDVDSFDDGIVYRPIRNLDPNDETGQKMHRYRSQMYKSKGFEVDAENFPGPVAYRSLLPIDLDEPFNHMDTIGIGLTGREYMQSMVDLALERYNRVKGFTVTCVSIVRAIVGMVSGIKCYITFMARESPDGDLVEYQAKTEKRIWQKKIHVIFCRPTPEPQEPMEVEYTDSTTDGEESDGSSRSGSSQEWDVDSFDEGTNFKPPTKNAPPDDVIEKMRLYRPHMYKSKGFLVDGEYYPGPRRYFTPVDLNKELWPTRLTGRQYMEKMVHVALDKYNEMKGSNVTLEYIVRANLSQVNGNKSYITFMAREVPGGNLVEYQAKTERKNWQRKYHAILCRPSPKSKD